MLLPTPISLWKIAIVSLWFVQVVDLVGKVLWVPISPKRKEVQNVLIQGLGLFGVMGSLTQYVCLRLEEVTCRPKEFTA